MSLGEELAPQEAGKECCGSGRVDSPFVWHANQVLEMSTTTNRISEPADGGLVYGQGATMQSLNAKVAEIARTDIPVLLIGESGTGKEVYARLIHRLSSFSETPLMKVSCTALDAGRDLLSQVQQSLQRTNHTGDASGSLFLDRVDELDLSCQRVLLSVLSDGELTSGPRQARIRLISSTSQNLEKEVAAGRFRRELYFRINGLCLHLPPLCERKKDIPALFGYFLAKHAGELKRRAPSLSSEAMDALTSYDWPGNIRELENMAKKIVALGDAGAAIGDLHATTLAITKPRDCACASSFKAAARAASRRTERELILQALARTRWNRKRAAQELQISYKSLLYKIKQIGMEEPDAEEL